MTLADALIWAYSQLSHTSSFWISGRELSLWMNTELVFCLCQSGTNLYTPFSHFISIQPLLYLSLFLWLCGNKPTFLCFHSHWSVSTSQHRNLSIEISTPLCKIKHSNQLFLFCYQFCFTFSWSASPLLERQKNYSQFACFSQTDILVFSPYTNPFSKVISHSYTLSLLPVLLLLLGISILESPFSQ